MEEKIQEWLKEAYSVFNLPVDCQWSWNFRAIQVAGKAFYKDNKITLSHRYFSQVDDSAKRITVIHEACHLISYKLYGERGRGHGRLWKSCMIRCGLKPNRCHSSDFHSHKKKEVKCGCGIIKIGPTRYKRLLNNKKTYRCVKCRQMVQPIEALQE